jgi:hypothetical protein
VIRDELIARVKPGQVWESNGRVMRVVGPLESTTLYSEDDDGTLVPWELEGFPCEPMPLKAGEPTTLVSVPCFLHYRLMKDTELDRPIPAGDQAGRTAATPSTEAQVASESAAAPSRSSHELDSHQQGPRR